MQFAVGSSWQRQQPKQAEVPQQPELAPQQLELVQFKGRHSRLLVVAEVERALPRHWQQLQQLPSLMHKHTPCWQFRRRRQASGHPVEGDKGDGCQRRAQVEARGD